MEGGMSDVGLFVAYAWGQSNSLRRWAMAISAVLVISAAGSSVG